MIVEQGMRITIDTSQVEAMLQAAGADMPAFLDDLKGQAALQTQKEEHDLTPVAVKDWTEDYRSGKHKKGELRRSVDIFPDRDRIIVGPTATARGGYPYGISVIKGIAFQGRPAKVGPRNFPLQTMQKMDSILDGVIDAVADKHMRGW